MDAVPGATLRLALRRSCSLSESETGLSIRILSHYQYSLPTIKYIQFYHKSRHTNRQILSNRERYTIKPFGILSTRSAEVAPLGCGNNEVGSIECGAGTDLGRRRAVLGVVEAHLPDPPAEVQRFAVRDLSANCQECQQFQYPQLSLRGLEAFCHSFCMFYSESLKFHPCGLCALFF